MTEQEKVAQAKAKEILQMLSGSSNKEKLEVLSLLRVEYSKLCTKDVIDKIVQNRKNSKFNEIVKAVLDGEPKVTTEQAKAKIRELLLSYTQSEKSEILTALCKENGVPTLFD